ncbi:MAG TPA: phosphate regulon transcriptional regulator PhoB [Allosphingosinicella sp.]|nr:phosphate regulon transcriptional regulator PhoB [Allosphingosinicella sp.]
MARGRVLVVEDDEPLAELLRFHLNKAGFEVDHTVNGDEALLRCQEDPPHLILLDWMIEGTSGIEVCRRLRRRPETSKIPIVMLSARGEESDRVRGLEIGADDYVTKPFSPKELIARVEAVLRRAQPSLASEQLSYRDLVMDLASHRVTRGSRTVHLGPTEFRLLRELLASPGRVLSRERLLNTVWKHDPEVEARTVDVHIRRLRQVLNAGEEPDLIRTVRGAGYALDADASGKD